MFNLLLINMKAHLLLLLLVIMAPLALAQDQNIDNSDLNQSLLENTDLNVDKTPIILGKGCSLNGNCGNTQTKYDQIGTVKRHNRRINCNRDTSSHTINNITTTHTRKNKPNTNNSTSYNNSNTGLNRILTILTTIHAKHSRVHSNNARWDDTSTLSL